jgi:hypothetical protein
MAMTAGRLDHIDHETTAAWMAGRRFTKALASLDLEVYEEDKIRPPVGQLAGRWKWTEDEVRAFVHPDRVTDETTAQVSSQG